MEYNKIAKNYCRYCMHISRKTIQAALGTFETNYCAKFNRTYTDASIRNSKECFYFEDAKRDILQKDKPKTEKQKRLYPCPYCEEENRTKGVCAKCRDKLPLVKGWENMKKNWEKKYGKIEI